MTTLRGAILVSPMYGAASRSTAGPSRPPMAVAFRTYAETVDQSSTSKPTGTAKSSSKRKAKPKSRPTVEDVSEASSESSSQTTSNDNDAAATPSPETLTNSERNPSPGWLTRRQRAAARPRQPLGTKPIARDILANLVSLHHASASFMHSSADIMTGFDNAFKNIEAEPYFMPYRRWKKGVVSHVIEGSNIRERPVKEGLPPLGKELEDRETLEPSYLYWKTFKKVDTSWTANKREFKGLAKSEREKQVKEALFGVWDRGGTGMEDVRPSLDGMEEWLKAKGVETADFAREWRERHGT